jgi:eukaryotic-like serine/threonine-protein kinase
MPDERATQVAELVKTAIECQPEARESFLDANCQPELRAEVESLLEHQEFVDQFIETPALDLAAETLAQRGAFGAGEIIGDCEIISLIGRGGMGEVYLAQDCRLHRRVALKLVRRGMDTDDIIRRFQHEQKLLASLNHPNIAQLYDAGVTADGIPFFIMEYVDGIRIDDYCRAKKLTIAARLELFGKVCGAVHYAHQHLVVHRDIKPSNILVTAEGEPKLLDFGIAKLIDAVTNAATEQTITLQNVLTPEYASPEQVRGEPITTASDVYSLGVLLYELLTGSKPYRIETRGPVEIARVITEQEPTKPSMAVQHRDSPDSRITNHDSRALRGDLDNIVLMAMRKQPSRRYSSVAQLTADIRRHLDGLPVSARKDRFAYRASKFITRNKIGVAAAAAVLLTILAGLIISIWQARIARRERGKAEAVNQFLQTTLLSSSPDSVARRHKNDATIQDVLNEVSRRLAAGELSYQPEVKAELQRIIGATYQAIGRSDLALQNLTSALELQTRVYGKDHPETFKTRVVLADVWVNTGEFAKAEEFYDENLPAMRRDQQRGRVDADYLINALYNVALLRRHGGDPKEAETILREILSLLPQASPDLKSNADSYYSTFALTLADQGKFDEAEQIVRPKIAALRQEQNGALVNGPDLCEDLTGLGNFLLGKGEYGEAEENLREAETIYRKIYDSTKMELGNNLRIQAQVLYHLGRYAEAEAKIVECLKIYRKWITPQYLNFATAITIQGMIYSKTNREAEAEKLLREAVRIRAQYMPEGHFLRAMTDGELGEFLAVQKRFDESEPLLLHSYEALKKSQSPNSPRLTSALQRLVALYDYWGRTDMATQYRRQLSASKF